MGFLTAADAVAVPKTLLQDLAFQMADAPKELVDKIMSLIPGAHGDE